MAAYSLDRLLAEASAQQLCVQSLCETYWSTREPKWTCWLRSLTNKHYACYGSGATAGEALNSALNATSTFDPEPQVEVSNLSFTRDIPSLDALLKRQPNTVAPGVIRRFNAMRCKP